MQNNQQPTYQLTKTNQPANQLTRNQLTNLPPPPATLQDGAYLSSELTQSLTATLLTYNPQARVFGYW